MSELPVRPIVRLPGEAESVQMGRFDVIYHAVGAETAGAFTLLETHEQSGGVGPPLHVHRDAAESFLVLNARLHEIADRYSMEVLGPAPEAYLDPEV